MANQYTHAWTPEDIEILETSIGTMSFNAIAKKLGKTPGAVSRQADKLGISNTKLASGLVTMHELAQCLCTYDKKIKRLIDNEGLPGKRRDFRIRKALDGKGNRRNEKRLLYYIDVEEFWEWAEDHKDAFNWYPVPKNSLVPEPEWVDERRKEDYYKWNEVNFSWTDEKNEQLWRLFYEEDLKQKEIAVRLGCTHNAVRKQLFRLREKKKKQKAEAL